MYKQHLELISLMPEQEEKPEQEEPEQESAPAEEAFAQDNPAPASDPEEDAFFDEVSKAETKRIDLDVQE